MDFSFYINHIGYVGGNETRISAFDSDGWLKTGDLCYFDEDGFLYVVDRLKDLIKYKAYQVFNMFLFCHDLVALIPLTHFCALI